MKKSSAIIFFLLSIFFLSNTNAQSLNTLKKKASKNISNDRIATYQKLLEKPEVQSKVKDQLISNEYLRTKTMSFLQKEPSIKTDVASILGKVNTPSSGIGLKSVSKSSIMSSLLSNPKILTAALGFVKNDPKILTKVMGLIGL